MWTLAITAAGGRSLFSGLTEGASRTTESSDDRRTDSLGSGYRLFGGHLSGAALRQKSADGAAARPGAGEHHKEKQVEDGQE